ncbi:MAG: AMP-binding protein [Treponema sp.]|nr:AMP-binding protein [Treponema sp.]
MGKFIERKPWLFLDEYKGKIFNGEWPTFPELLKIQVQRFAERPLFTDFEGPIGSKNTLTYNQVYQKVIKLALWLCENGIKKGDRVVISGKNSPEWAVSYLASFFAGAIAVPIDCALRQNEVCNLIKTAEPKITLTDDDKLDFIKKEFPGVIAKSLNPTVEENYVYNLKANAGTDESALSAEQQPACDDTAVILFTSGTTGNPKGVMLSHKNLISDAFIAQTNLDIYPTDVFYALLPIHHAYTMQAAFICPISCGAEIVFGKSMAVSKLMRELCEGKISVMLGVPLLYNKLLAGIRKGIAAKGPLVVGLLGAFQGLSFIIKKLTGKNIGKLLFQSVLRQANIYTLRVAICGGGPLAASVFRTYNAMGIDFIQGYGLTETSPIITLNPIENFKLISVGRDFSPYEEIKIINAKEGVTSKGRGMIGEIAVKGPMVMQGYYKMPEETAKMFTEDGFLKTGDLGWIDREHYVMLCGRAKNLIVTNGGKNVYPEEIEDAFQLCDNVQQITVQGYTVEGDDASEEIEALIYPSDDLIKKLGIERTAAGAEEKILEEINKDVSAVNKNLQPYQRITRVTILSQPLEMTTTQKVKRNYK